MRAATIGLILAFAVEADRRPVGIVLGVLVALALSATVVGHWSRRRRRAATRTLLRTLGDVVLATGFVVAAGSVLAVVAALLLAAVASSVVGDGSVVVRFVLALFAVCPCLAIGSRCGRWWAFAGAIALVPLLGFAMLVDGQASTNGIEFLGVAGLATSLALAAGSLSKELADSATSERRQRRAVSTAAAAVVPARHATRAATRGR